ncbi:MAG: hypothetical protein ABI682_07100 [Acidobacteriota bacterium]
MSHAKRFLPPLLLSIVAISCASVQPAEVRLVRQGRDIRGRCELLGRVVASAAGQPADVERQLRKKAFQRGGNTVLLEDDPTATRGVAYRCDRRISSDSVSNFGTPNGTDGPYGPRAPDVDLNKSAVTPRAN